jgi:hypothetical protein
MMRPDVCLLLYSGAVQRRRRFGAMSEPAREMPADSPAVENARQGVITHLTAGSKRVAAILPAADTRGQWRTMLCR